MKKIAIMQPYFIPYIGYFQIMNAVDEYVIYDDVSYIKGGRINRNNILVNNMPKSINILLKGSSQNKLINEIALVHDKIYEQKTLKTIQMSYAKAPYFEPVYDLVERIILNKESNLALYLRDSFSIICDYLKINTVLTLSSSIDKDNSLAKEEKIYQICKILNADEYFNSIGGVDLYSPEDFKRHGRVLRFLKMDEKLSYKQFGDGFVPNLSIVDVMMFNNVEMIRKMLLCYSLL